MTIVTASWAQTNYKTFTVGGVTFKMIKVEGGTFTTTPMVTLSDYYIGQTEVTQALWKAVMGTTPSQLTTIRPSWDIGEGANYPMYAISWEDCQEFVRKLNVQTGQRFRLPTESEWEFAAKGGNQRHGYLYSGSNDIDAVAWKSGNSRSMMHTVGTKIANELGLYDMSGNVWEWCQDWYAPYNYSSSAKTNPTGPATGTERVRRGGSWNSIDTFCRVSKRESSQPSERFLDVGLRLAL